MTKWYRTASPVDRALVVTTAGATGVALIMSYLAVVATMVYN